MTTNTNTASGRTRTPQQNPAQHNPQTLDRDAILSLTIIIVGFIGAVILIVWGVLAPVTVVNKSKDALIIDYNMFTQFKSLPELQTWIPEALNLDEATVNSVNLDDTKDGTPGSVILTNGETIPFTLHNYNGTFIVEEG